MLRHHQTQADVPGELRMRKFAVLRLRLPTRAVGPGSARHLKFPHWRRSFTECEKSPRRRLAGGLFTVEVTVEYIVDRCRLWKLFRLFSTRSSCRPRIGLHAGQNGIDQPWCETPCGNTCGGWRRAFWKSATAKDTLRRLQRAVIPTFGNWRRHGRPNSPRRCAPVQLRTA